MVVARTTNFLKTGTQTTGVIDYVVPAGKVAAVTSITFAKQVVGAACTAYAAIFAPGDSTTTIIAAGVLPSTTILEVISWLGRVVLEDGWTLRVGRLNGTGQWASSAAGFLYSAS